MARKLQIKRGLKAGMPTLAQGELAMTIDAGSESVFIGTGTENIELARKSDLDAIPTPDVSGQIGTHNSDPSAHSDIRESITTHTGDTSIHVTAEEKATWNAKATTSYVDQKISEIPTPDETDPTVPAWAKAASKPTYTASEVGAVPTSRTVNGKTLSANITLSASDVGAATMNEVNTAIQTAIGNAIGGSY